jgi:hypothetical protein
MTKKLENKFDKIDTKLYVKFKKPRSVREFLLKFFTAHTLHQTHYTGGATWNNQECTNLQCDTNKWRSFDDVYYLVRTYFPTITPKRLIHELLVLYLNGTTKRYLQMGTCGGMSRIRIIYFTGPLIGYDINKYSSVYSWPELLAMLDIKSTTDLQAYLDKHTTNA